MTTQLTNEQMARVFAMYYPQKVQGFKEWSEEKGYWYPYLELDSMAHALKQMSIGLMNFKLLLTPLSSISDEDAIEVAKIIMGDYFSQNAKPFIERKDEEILLNVQGWNIIRIHYKDGTILWSEQNRDWRFRYNNKIPFAFQYLIQKGYAVPLFIEPNHLLNGKTAIELGLAIDKTKEVSHG